MKKRIFRPCPYRTTISLSRPHLMGLRRHGGLRAYIERQVEWVTRKQMPAAVRDTLRVRIDHIVIVHPPPRPATATHPTNLIFARVFAHIVEQDAAPASTLTATNVPTPEEEDPCPNS